MTRYQSISKFRNTLLLDSNPTANKIYSANSAAPDQTAHKEQSDQDLHYLPLCPHSLTQLLVKSIRKSFGILLQYKEYIVISCHWGRFRFLISFFGVESIFYPLKSGLSLYFS